MTGAVRTIIQLDRETVARYDLGVEVSDAGSPSLNAFGTITILVTDENDNDPIFGSSTISATVAENSITNTFVVTAFASDADEGTNGQLFFSIMSGNSLGAFQIDNATGIVTVRQSSVLDFETRENFYLQVQASDMGNPRRSSQVLVS